MGKLNLDIRIKNLRNRKALSDLIKSVFTSGTAAGVAQFLMVVYSLLAARLLNADSYGVMGACYSATALTSFLFNWGLDSWLLKSASTSPSPLELTGRVLRIKLFMGLIWGATLWFLLPSLRPDLYIAPVLFIILIDTLFDSFTNVLYVSLTVAGRIPEASGILLINRILRLLSVVILVYFGNNNLVLLVFCRMFLTVFSFLFGFIIARPKLLGYSKENIIRETAPFALSEILMLGYFQIDLNIVSFFTNDKTIIGNYSIIMSLTNAISAVIVSINNVLLPIFTRIYQKRSMNFLRMALFTLMGFFFLGGFISIGSAFWGEEIINMLLGNGYIYAGIFLKLIAPLFILKALSQTASMLLVVIDLQKQRVFPQAFALIWKVISGLWVFPKWQVIGIIQVYIISEFFMVVGYAILAYQWYKKSWLSSYHKFPTA
jgi:O-antigen/teichoic acid export membrane protein